ncbi:hypothetical protein D9756_006720 [Leucocoprinus leucothites]|uniref:Uncharacterized protein n=1 Tax=Leucocoprinus leucothites TaxID=201217 RepID=A0A8H5LGY6_9AGAR|nr:hypothetical protein D9756_006720 [Leucoagaricus leucothites]
MASHRDNRIADYDDDIFDEDRHHDSHQHKAKLPVIPDLRFEYSYLRSIRPYVHVERLGEGPRPAQQQRPLSAEELLSDYEKVELPGEVSRGDAEEQSSVQSPSTGPKEIIHVQWKRVIWVTTRDQVISPLLQGALWAIASYFLTPYSANLGSKLGHLMHAKAPQTEGNAAGWLRKWVKSLGLTSKSAEESKR